MTGMPPACTGLGSAGESGQPVVPPVEVEGLAGRRAPQPGDDRELLLVAVEPLPQRRERDAVGGVLGLEPAGADAELDPAAAHLVDLGHRDRQRPGQPEGGRRHQRAQPDPAGLAGQPGERHPGVGRAGQAVAAHRQVVVGPEEGVEAGLLGAPGDGQQVVVGGAHLGFGEDPQFHAPTLTSPGVSAPGAHARGVLTGRTGQDDRRDDQLGGAARVPQEDARSGHRRRAPGGLRPHRGGGHRGRPPRGRATRSPGRGGPRGRRPQARRGRSGPARRSRPRSPRRSPPRHRRWPSARDAIAPRVEAAREAIAPRRRGRARRRGAAGGGRRDAAQAAAARQRPTSAPRVEAAQKAAQKALKDDVVPRLEAAQNAALAYAAPRVVAARDAVDPGAGERPGDAGRRRGQRPQRARRPPGRAGRGRGEVDAQGPQDGEEGAQDRRQEAPRVREEGRGHRQAGQARRRRAEEAAALAVAARRARRSPRVWSCSCAGRSRTPGRRPPPATARCPSYREDPVPSSPSTAGKTVSDAEFAAGDAHSRRQSTWACRPPQMAEGDEDDGRPTRATCPAVPRQSTSRPTA